MGENKQLARNMAFNIMSFVINLGISFFLTPYLVSEVGREAYGFIPLVNNMIGYTSIITTAVGSMAGRFITMRLYKDDYEGASYYFNSVLVANLILSALFTILAIFTIAYLPFILNIPSHLLSDVRWLFTLATLSLILGLSTGILGCGVYIKNRIDIGASTSMSINFTRVGCILLLFAFLKPSIIYISLGAFLSSLLSTYYSFSFKRRFLPEIPFKPIKYFSWSRLKEVTFSGIWNSVNQLSNLLLYQLDLLITNIFISAAATGEFSLSKIMPTMILSFLATLSGSFYPKFNILYAQQKTNALYALVKKSIKIVGLFVSLAIGLLVVYSDIFYKLWLPSENSQKLYLLTIITVVPMIFGGSINPVFGLFSTANKLRIPSLVLLFAGIMNTLIIFILLKTTDLGIWAIALTSAVQGGVRNALFSPIYGAHCIGQKWYALFPTMFKAICGLLIVISVGFIIKNLLPTYGWISFISVATLTALISLLINQLVILNNAERQYLKSIVLKKIKR
ncbi:MAG: oligosaccharide flippase family protein [Bacteroidaceae bacterium]|nr:oligosaccharide flippase family protein [Bacteroidaceae bacterium]